MLYEFKSRATGSVVMTEDVGNQVMKALGREPAARGVITVEQIPGAIAALQAAGRNQPATPASGDGDQDDEDADMVAFSARVLPLIEMLGEARKAGKDVTWGV
ncbi:MAG: DUF1840 domain-containing protein [Burkholderiaceae bacterium]